MNVDGLNDLLVRGEIDRDGLFPHLEELAAAPFVFAVDFGLDELPPEPGLLIIRGPRQIGKSTWLEGELRRTIEVHGPGSGLYLNGDTLANADQLIAALRELLLMFDRRAPIRRIFIDEITAVRAWERGLKLLVDSGELRRVLVVTTGSRATDLRRGGERLPGRRGRLDRTNWLFTPVSFAEFRRVCATQLGSSTLEAYMLGGGSPVALAQIASTGRLPEWVAQMARDWVGGEISRTGRDRASLVSVIDTLLARGGSPIGQTLLAREAGLANNTVAAGYIELLADLMCVGIQQAWDESRRRPIPRRRAKYPFTNLLVAAAWHPSRPRRVSDLRRMDESQQAAWLEWLVAQEIWRRRAIQGDDFPERMHYWASARHEVDFVVRPDLLLEVKRGRAGPREFGWFAASFPKARLWVISRDRFETDHLRGRTFEDLLLDPDW